MSNKKIIFLLALFLVFGFIIRVYLSNILPLTSDEGSYLYDGLLIKQGNFPFKDFFTRSPFFISEIAGFIGIFGQKINAGRLLSITSALLTSLIIYFIAKRLSEKKLGLVAAAFYLILPSTVFQTIYLHTQASEMLFVAFSVLIIILGVQKNKKSLFFLSGVILGVSFFIRQSVILFGIAGALYLFFQKEELKKRLYNILLFCFGFLIIFGIGIFILIYFAGFQKIWLTIGPGLIFSLQKSASSVGTFSFKAIQDKITGLESVAKESLFLIFLFIIFLGSAVFKKEWLPELKNRGYLFLFLILALPFLGYFFYSAFDPNYFAEFLLALVIMAGIVFLTLFEKNKKVFVGIILVGLLMIIFSYYSGIINPHTGQYSLKTILEAANYIKENSDKNEQVLTSALAIPFVADRGVALNIVHPTIFRYGRILEKDRNTLVPSISELQNYLETNKVKFVIIDQNFKNTFFKFHEVFENYIKENYTRAKIFKPKEKNKELLVVEIWERKDDKK